MVFAQKFLKPLVIMSMAAMVFLVNSCGGSKKIIDSSKLNVIGTNFSDGVIETQQNLLFTFDKELAPDSILNLWDSTAFLSITPKVSGKFKWISSKEVLFSPDYGFKPSTDYQASVSENVFKYSTNKVKIGTVDPLKFHTPYLTLSQVGTYWYMDEKSGDVKVKMDVFFNLKVAPDDVKKKLTIHHEGGTLDYTITTASISDRFELQLNTPNSKDFDGSDIEVRIAKGLKCQESDYSTTAELKETTKVPYKDKFSITSIQTGVENEKAFVEIHTNQPVAKQNIKSFIKFSPNVNFTVVALDYGLLIKGDFNTEKSYEIKINKKLKGLFGYALDQAVSQYVTFGEVDPSITFVDKKAVYLSSAGKKNIPITITNVPKVRLRVIKIYQNNILQFLKKSGAFNYYYDDYYYGSSGGYEEYGDVIVDKELRTSSFAKMGQSSLYNFNFEDINAYKGIYVVKVQSTDDRWVKAEKTVSFSDVGLVVKETEDDVLVFANSILKATPLSGVKINLISSNNQSVYELKTNEKGIAHFKSLKTKAKGFKIKMVTALHQNDFTYLHFKQSYVDKSDFEVGGLWLNETGYQAFIYGDRNIYRPGEKVNFNVVIRDKDWKPVTKMPVKLVVKYPNGKTFKSIRGKLNAQGAFENGFELPSSVLTGTYTMQLLTSNDVVLNTRGISVEEFIPDRIKVNTSLNKKSISLSKQLVLKAEALNMFGPPAANRNYEVEVQLSRKYFSPKQYSDYNFSLSGINNQYYKRIFKDGKTSESGMISQTFSFPPSYKNSGVLSGRVYTTVFDESGRPVNRINSFELQTQKYFYGIKNIDYYLKSGTEVKVPLVAVNIEGEAQTGVQANVEVIKYDWQSVLRKNYNGRLRYVSEKKQRVILSKKMTLNGKNSFVSFKPTESGSYEIRVNAPNAKSYVSRSFYAYRYGSTSSTSFEVNKEGKIDIELNKDEYEIGDEAEILLKGPFRGKMIITVERDKVYEHFVKETDGKTVKLKLPIKEAYLPNVFISATLIKAHSDGAIPLTVAHGYQLLKTNKKSNRIPVEIKTVEKSRSKSKQKICIKTKPESDIEVTVAVVDEGILQLKNYKTPDPYAFFYQTRALKVNSHDLYPRLFPEYSMRSNFGSGGYDLEKRVNPLTNKRVKLVSFWSGILKTNSKGEACYEVDIPQFSGSLRVMACAYKDQNFGAASKEMKVADPVVVTTSLPRFLTPMDTVLVPVTMSNTTSKSSSAIAKLRVSGPLEIIGEAQKESQLSPNSEKRVVFKVCAKAEIGEAQIKTQVEALSETFTEDNDITVRPGTSLLKKNGSGVVSGGANRELTLTHDYIPSSVDAKLVISRSPMVQFSDDLRYLVGYPYGCVEQTVSKAFPQLYFHDMMKSMGIKKMVQGNPQYYVNQAIIKLQSMQLYSGGLSYWPGRSRVNWWGSAYAAHFLYEASRAGYEVDQKVLDKLFNYLKREVRDKEYEQYWYYENGVKKQRKIIPRHYCYSLYVLALAGQKELSTMNYMKSNLSYLSLDAKYLLAASYYASGDKATYNEILPRNFSGERAVKVSGGSFHSFIRDEAIALNALISVDPGNSQIAQMARHLTKQMKSERYLSTQERSFAMLALGKLAKKANNSTVTAVVSADGKEVGEYKGNTLVLKSGIKGKAISISTKGSGDLYYFWEVEGISKSGEYNQEDKVLRVRKTFYNRDGTVITNGQFTQNDLIVVKLSVSTIDQSKVENVVVTDVLPAGFEIENPRLTSIPGMNWLKNKSYPEHFDVRDDRINFFTNVNSYTKNFYYMVRAVTPGKFVMGPVGADAMYNGEYHSYHGAGTVVIEEK